MDEYENKYNLVLKTLLTVSERMLLFKKNQNNLSGIPSVSDSLYPVKVQHFAVPYLG